LQERTIFILAARMPPLSVRSKLVPIKLSSVCMQHYRTFVLLAIFKQVYNFSFMHSYENQENIAVSVPTMEFNFHIRWRLEQADL
jgi:hypothetical protein